jgi:DNA polymerase-4
MEKPSSFFFISREGDSYSETFKRVRMMPLYSFPHFRELNPLQRNLGNRYFLHLDFDAFYAQVEQRDNPKLRGKPVAVGSSPGGKGIVMTASYEARALGVETGSSMYEAKKICPSLIDLPCYGTKYESILQNIQSELKQFVPEEFIEQYSIDECFLDLTPVVKDWEDARRTASFIKFRILEIENLTASIGCSWNKTYAKIATKLQKPNGLTVITPEDKARIYALPVKKMWGIGTRIERRLSLFGIKTIGDLAEFDEYVLKREFGINGIVFRKLARGEDTSGIFRKQLSEKCLSHQHSMSQAIYKTADVQSEIRRVSEYICRKLRDKELVAGGMFLTLRYENLRYAGDDIKLRTYTNDDREIYEHALELFSRFPKPRKSLRGRAFGIAVFDLLKDPRRNNLELFEQKTNLPYYALDKLKYKYGEGIIRVGLSRV